ncbi:condensation protein [Affinibrenneria salicis]|uniref:Condensation protein n=2 Tax=Affinibrenneria salicis TaxID=2590031 RepID=A0A5J5G3A8_9GAMM|nr:condensation protein [Affinibrenneria salicis]
MAETERNADWLPLTLAQLDFWEEFTLYPERPISTVAHYIDIQGAVDAAALAEAITMTIRESDVFALRFQFARHGPAPLQRCDPAWAPPLRRVDLRDSDHPLAAARRHMQHDVEQRLDLLSQPLAAHWLIRVGETRYLWYIRAHHIIIDGYGMALIEHRCAGLYAHFLGQRAAGVAFHPFARYLAGEQAYSASPRCAADRRYWRHYLASPVSLPVLHKGGGDYGAPSLHFSCQPSERFGADLQRLAGRCDIGWPDLLLALSGAYLFHHLAHKVCGERQTLPLWVPFMNRRCPVAAWVPALAVNILPLWINIGAQERLGEFLQRVMGELHSQRAHGRYRIEQIAADQRLPSSGSRYFFSPLVNVLPFDAPGFVGCRTSRHVIASGPGDGFNLTWRGQMDGGGLIADVDADPALYREEAFFRHRQTLPAFMLRAVRETALNQRLQDLLNAPDQR